MGLAARFTRGARSRAARRWAAPAACLLLALALLAGCSPAQAQAPAVTSSPTTGAVENNQPYPVQPTAPGYPGEPTTGPTEAYPGSPQPTAVPPEQATAGPTLSPTVTSSPAPTKTTGPSPTPVPSDTPTPDFTPTATPPPVMAGTPLPAIREQIIEINLEQVRPLAIWGKGRATGTAWSPDGRLIAVSSTLGVYLYDASTLNPLGTLQTGSEAHNLVFSADSARLALSVINQGPEGRSIYMVQVWDLAANAWTHALLSPDEVTSLVFTNNGSSLAAIARLQRGADQGGLFEIWNYMDGETTPGRVKELVAGEVFDTSALSPDLTIAASHGPRGPVRLWRLEDGANYATTDETRTNAGPLAFSPDGTLLAVGYPDLKVDFVNTNAVRTWTVPDPWGQEPAALVNTLADVYTHDMVQLAEGTDQVLLNVSWSPDGSLIAAGFADRTIKAWYPGGSAATRRFFAETIPFGVAWSPDGAQIAAGELETFDVPTAQRTGFTNDFIPALYGMDISPDGQRLAIAGYRMIDIRSMEDGSRLFNITGMSGPVNGVDYSEDGEFLVSAGSDGVTRLFTAENGTFLRTEGDPGREVLTAAFSPNSKWIAVGRADMTIQIFRVLDGLILLGRMEPFASYRLLFSPNVDQLASLTTSGVRLRSFGGELQAIYSELQATVGGVGLSDMAYSPGEESFALVGNGLVRVVDPGTFDTRYTLHDPAGAQPFSVAFSPDNAFLVVGWSDGSIRFYWAATGMPMRTLPAHPQPVMRLMFTRDGTLLLSQGAEGTIRLWGVTP